jgi:predicted ATPase
MITRIEIDGFKSFVDFSLDLHPFTAVIGTNASGKSNLLDAFRFLAAAAKGDLYDAVDAVRGDAESLFHQFADGSRMDTMRFALEFDSGENGLVPIRYEVCIGWTETDGLRSLRYEQTHLLVSHDRAIDGHNARAEARRFGGIETLRCLQLETEALRRTSSRTPRPDMAADGDGLPGYLARLRTETATKDDPQGVLRPIGIALHGLVPDITGFDVLIDDVRRDVRIELTSRNEPPFEATVASGGTLRVLATLAALFDPRQKAPLLIDEPENGVYPEQFRRLVRMMMDAAVPPRQVLIAGHSPAILDAVPPEQIVVLDVASRVGDGRKSRITRARRAAASDASDSTSNWGPLPPLALKRLRAGEEMPA